MSDDHLTLLGSQSSFFTNPDDARLESFPNRGTRPYTITLDTHEFSSLCPVTGQPDSCHLTITYVPAEKCVETKSLKYYLASYRNYPAFNEQIVNRITDDLVAAISPRWLKVEGNSRTQSGKPPPVIQTMDKMETAVLLSGGLDSSVALHWAHRNHRVRVALSFDYASNHAERELKCAAWQAASLGIEHRVIDISSISSHLKSALLSGADDIPDGSYDEELMKQTVVPFRNGIFLSIAAGVAESCGAQQLVIAAHSGDHSIYPDCREEFMAAMTEAIRLGTYAGLGILRPFIHMSKGGIAAMGQDLGVDFSRTYSCYKGGAVHCGVCSTCMERREAFREAGIPDPTAYAPAE